MSKGLQGFKRSAVLSPKTRRLVESGLTPVKPSNTLVVPELRLSFTSVDEGSSVGTFVGTPYVVNGKGTYTFTEIADPDSKFSIVGGNLVTTAALDYEAKTAHTVTIRANNGIDPAIDQLFTINVNNVYENALGPTSAVINVNAASGTVIATITGRKTIENEIIVGITPNDGRFAFTDSQVVVGLSALSEGIVNATVQMSTGRTLALDINISALPTYIESTSGASVSSTSQATVAKPTNAQVGDTLIIVFHTSSNITGITFSGWTPKHSSAYIHVWSRVVDGTEGSTFTIPFSSSSYKRAICMLWRAGDIVDAVGEASGTSGSPSIQGDTTTKSGIYLGIYGWKGSAAYNSFHPEDGKQSMLVNNSSGSTAAKLVISQYADIMTPGSTPSTIAVMSANPTQWGAIGLIIG